MKHIIKNAYKQLKAFIAREHGMASIEFVAMFPAAMVIMFIAGESAMVNLRKTNLDRALEMTIRELRLGKIVNPTSSSLRTLICSRMGNPQNCSSDLTLELSVRNITATNMTVPSLTATCVNRTTRIEPVLTFELGAKNDLVFVRACYVIDVLFPTSVGTVTVTESFGTEHTLVSTSAFVNEPR